MTARATADVAVIGAGVMGSATAWQLARRGVRVVVFEQFQQGHRRGSSHGDARIFRLAYADAAYVALAQAALPLWRALEEESGRSLLTVTGGVDHGDPAQVAAIAAALGARAVAYERVDPSHAATRWTGMRFGPAVVYQADAGRLDADAAVRALQDAAMEAGADFRFGSPVVDLAEVDASVVVVTAGAWVSKLLGASGSGDRGPGDTQAGGVGRRMPRLRITEQHPAHFRTRGGAHGWPAFLHHLGDGPELGFGGYGLPTADGMVKVGGEFAGREVDPDRRDGVTDSAQVEAVQRYVAEWLPGLEPYPAFVDSCLYTSTDDSHFVIDRVGAVVVGSPCSGHGFKFAPAIGALLADLAVGNAGSPYARWRLPG